MGKITLPENLSSNEHEFAKKFISITKGHNAYKVALQLNKMTPGINWCGCNKSDIISILIVDMREGRSIDLDTLNSSLMVL